MSADSVPSSKTNIFQSKLYTFIYCRHFRTYSRCAMFDWSDTVFRRRNVTRRRISNTVLQPRYWGSEADSPEVCRLPFVTVSMFISLYLRPDWLRSTGNFVVNHLKLFICNTIYIEPCQYNSFRYFKPQFQPQFRYPSLNSQFYHF
jgi:hypothetical protein